MTALDLIIKKRDGFAHTKDEIDFIINGFVNGKIDSYQMAAWLMTVYFNGMTSEEISLLTLSMLNSGDIIDLSELKGVKVDKHSTGGVGDTTTLIAAPIVAACGGTVAKMSGRGLSYSGGTLDKLESLPNVCVSKDIDEFKQIVNKTGLCVIGQTENLVPADKLIYALRDVTGTVPSIPLIASSIMSKKLASGADAIVLDIKVGNGAFVETVEKARILADTMVNIGKAFGKKVIAVITDMNRPLGMNIGNILELKEAVDVLKGRLDDNDPLVEVSITLAGYMLVLSNIAKNIDEAKLLAKAAIKDGGGFEKLSEMLISLGGDKSDIDNIDDLCKTEGNLDIKADRNGYISKILARNIGIASLKLGAGRERKEDSIDPSVGIIMKKRIGDNVEAGDVIAVLKFNDDKNIKEAEKLVKNAIEISDEKAEDIPIIYEVIGGN